MQKYLSRHCVGYLLLPALFLVGMLILSIRNPDPFLNPILYTEDGAWLGLAFTKGWLYTFYNAKEGYLVLGNLLLLWASEIGGSLLCGDSLSCLPQAIGIVSLAFYSFLATFAFVATKEVASFAVRLVLFVMLLLLPLGDSSNEILGRLSNVGYMFVLLSLLLVSYRESLKKTTSVFIADVVLIISAATNPVVTLLIVIYLTWRLYQSRGRKWKDDLILLLGICIVAVLIAYRMLSQHHSEVTGILHSENLVEVGVARAILYPLLFPYYTSLSDFSAIAILIIWLLFVFLAIWRSGDRTRLFIVYSLVALMFFWALTLLMRPSLTQQLSDYNHTFPDRYFMGINAIVMVITLVGTQSLLSDSKLILKGGALLLVAALIMLYVKKAPWIFETYKTRMPIMTGVSFFDQLCESSKTLTKAEGGGLVVVPIYFKGWSISIPSQLLLAATEKLDCQALTPLNISDQNWNHGVARNWSGLVLASFNSTPLLQSGKVLRFADGSTRTILKLELSGSYLNVFLDGMPLDGNIVGRPNKVEIIK